MFANIHENRIIHVFKSLNIGDVHKVDLVPRSNKNGDTYNMAFIHFHTLYDSESAKTFKQDVENPAKQAKIVYEDPWFWLVLPFEQKNKHLQNQMLQHVHVPMNNTTHINSNGQNNSRQLHQNPNVVPIWTMTPYGPTWQWGYLPTQPVMVPPQVMYGNKINQYRHHPKKRINVPTPTRNNLAQGYEHPIVTTTKNINNEDDKEEGEC